MNLSRVFSREFIAVRLRFLFTIGKYVRCFWIQSICADGKYLSATSPPIFNLFERNWSNLSAGRIKTLKTSKQLHVIFQDKILVAVLGTDEKRLIWKRLVDFLYIHEVENTKLTKKILVLGVSYGVKCFLSTEHPCVESILVTVHACAEDVRSKILYRVPTLSGLACIDSSIVNYPCGGNRGISNFLQNSS